MTESSIGVAVIGAGMAGRSHAQGYRSASTVFDTDLPDVRLVAIADVNAEFADDAAKRFGYERAETSWEAVAAASDIDAVSIVVANPLHREIAEALLAAGTHVLCEKPLAPTVVDAQAMVKAADASDRVAAVGMSLRRSPAINAVREQLGDGGLGRVLHFNGHYWCDYGCDPDAPMSWRYKGRPGTGALADIGSHLVDLSEFLCGPVDRVSGASLHRNPRSSAAGRGDGGTRRRAGQRGARTGRERRRRDLHGVVRQRRGRYLLGLPGGVRPSESAGLRGVLRTRGGHLRPGTPRRVHHRRPRTTGVDQRLPADAGRPRAPVRRPGHADGLPGLASAEINAGGFVPAPHLPIEDLRGSTGAREEYLGQFDEAGIALTGLNVNGNPLHPDPEVGPAHTADLHQAIEVAGLLGVRRLVAMSGLPASDPGAAYPSWVVNPWDSAYLEVLDYQWDEVAVPFWKDIDARARDADVKVCIEMHPHNIVFNPATLERLVTAVDATNVGAEMDPSHLFWQGIDPIAAIERLGELVFHAAAKDTAIHEENRRVYGVLDDRHTRVPPEENPTGLGGRYTLNRWPDDPAWEFVAVGRGHDEDLWASFLQALHRADPDIAVNIEHEDQAFDQVEGLRIAADDLRAAAAKAGV